MKKAEKEIESYLTRKVRALGGLSYKWVSPGNAGVPDRILLFPEGRVVFVELKAEGKKNNLSPLQVVQMLKIKSLGHKHYVVDSFEEVDQMLEEVMPK